MKKLFESWRNHLSSLDETMKDLKDVKAKYAEDLQMSDAVAKFEEADPSGNHKYIRWMTKQAEKSLKQGNLEQDIAEIIDSIKDFHKFSNMGAVGKEMKKDLNAYKTLEMLVSDVESAKQNAEKKTAAKQKARKASLRAKKESVLIHDDDKFMVLRPTSEHASCYYGRGTKWCISATDSENYFNRPLYYGKVFYFVLDKTRDNIDPLKKVAWVGNSEGKFEEWRDALDGSLSQKRAGLQLKKTDASLGKKIIAKMKSHLKSNPAPQSPIDEIVNLVDEANSRLKNVEVTHEAPDEFSNETGTVMVNARMELLLPSSGEVERNAEQLSAALREDPELVHDALEKVFSRKSLMDFSAYEYAEFEHYDPSLEYVGTGYGIVIKFIVVGEIHSADEARKFLDDVENKLYNKRDLISRKLFEELVDMGIIEEEEGLL